jgi:hypothetical protein
MNGVGSIYQEIDGKLERVIEFRPMSSKETIQLLPGKYTFIFRQANVTEAIFTKMQKFEINAGTTTLLRF